MKNQKKWNPDLWKPLGIKPIDTEKYVEKPGQRHVFYEHQPRSGRYVVRGIMPMPPKEEVEEE